MSCRTLRHFNTSSAEYSVVFVSNSTAATKLVAESFQFIEPCNCICRDPACVKRSADGTQQTCDVEEFPYTKCPRDVCMIGTDAESAATDIADEVGCRNVEKFLCLKSLHNMEISHQYKRLYNESTAASGVKITHQGECLSESDMKNITCMNSTESATTDIINDTVCKPTVRSCLWNGEPLTNPTFLYIDDNHTSVIGMRSIVAHHGAEFCCIRADDLDAFLLSLRQPNVEASSVQFVTEKLPNCVTSSASEDAVSLDLMMPGSQKHPHHIVNSLFAYPAQSNFSGHRYPLEWANTIHNWSEHAANKTCPCCGSKTHPHWYVLIDAAALLTTSTLDLSQHKPDFVALSFYKMFGFPTGLGMSACATIRYEMLF